MVVVVAKADVVAARAKAARVKAARVKAARAKAARVTAARARVVAVPALHSRRVTAIVGTAAVSRMNKMGPFS